MMHGLVRLYSAIVNNTEDWQTTEKERAFLLGIAALIHPQYCLELGVHKGGFTKHLVDFCDNLYCVDNEFKIEADMERKYNFYRCSTDNFFEKIANRIYDLIIIDAGHSEEEAYRDLKNSIEYGQIILMHDTFNQSCRAGYERAIAEKIDHLLYHQLDVVNGQFYREAEQWGGIGMVLVK